MSEITSFLQLPKDRLSGRFTLLFLEYNEFLLQVYKRVKIYLVGVRIYIYLFTHRVANDSFIYWRVATLGLGGL
jgi:hypothetical protein